MKSLIQDNAPAVAEICRHRQVVRMSLFGSGAGESFNPATSDLDFLVEFHPLTPARHADCYFGLQEDLERLFGRPVDLVEPGPIRNPFFRSVVEQTKVLVYAAP